MSDWLHYILSFIIEDLVEWSILSFINWPALCSKKTKFYSRFPGSESKSRRSIFSTDVFGDSKNETFLVTRGSLDLIFKYFESRGSDNILKASKSSQIAPFFVVGIFLMDQILLIFSNLKNVPKYKPTGICIKVERVNFWKTTKNGQFCLNQVGPNFFN